MKSSSKIYIDSLPVANLLIGSKIQIVLFGKELREVSLLILSGSNVSQINQNKNNLYFL